MDHSGLAWTDAALVLRHALGAGRRLRLCLASELGGRFDVCLDGTDRAMVADWGMGFACIGLGRFFEPVVSAVAASRSRGNSSESRGHISQSPGAIPGRELDWGRAAVGGTFQVRSPGRGRQDAA